MAFQMYERDKSKWYASNCEYTSPSHLGRSEEFADLVWDFNFLIEKGKNIFYVVFYIAIALYVSKDFDQENQ